MVKCQTGNLQKVRPEGYNEKWWKSFEVFKSKHNSTHPSSLLFLIVGGANKMLLHGNWKIYASKTKKCIRERSWNTQNQENDPLQLGTYQSLSLCVLPNLWFGTPGWRPRGTVGSPGPNTFSWILPTTISRLSSSACPARNVFGTGWVGSPTWFDGRLFLTSSRLKWTKKRCVESFMCARLWIVTVI